MSHSGEQDTKIFYVYQSENEELLAKIGSAIAKFIENSPQTSHKPLKNEVVLANFEGIFYRAVVQSKTDEGNFEVSFIDYGNKDTVKQEDMRAISEDLMFDAFVHAVYFENMPKEITEEFANLLGSGQVTLTNVKKLKDGYAAKVAGI